MTPCNIREHQETELVGAYVQTRTTHAHLLFLHLRCCEVGIAAAHAEQHADEHGEGLRLVALVHLNPRVHLLGHSRALIFVYGIEQFLCRGVAASGLALLLA